MPTGTKETQEAIAAFKSLTVRSIKALSDDGKIGWVEGAGFLGDLDEVVKALKGSNQILLELQDLDLQEKLAIHREIYDLLIAAGVTHRIADIADAALIWMEQTITFVLVVKNAPPTALPV